MNSPKQEKYNKKNKFAPIFNTAINNIIKYKTFQLK